MFETVAIVGATGAVGSIIRELLEARVSAPPDQIPGLGPLGRQPAGLCRPGARRRGNDARGIRGSRSGHWQHAGRSGAATLPLGGRARLHRGRRERLLADGSKGAAGRARGESRGAWIIIKGSSPARIVRPRRWWWRSSRCTTRPASAASWSAPIRRPAEPACPARTNCSTAREPGSTANRTRRRRSARRSPST